MTGPHDYNDGEKIITPVNTCPNSEFHGNPYRYCACGWMEAVPEVVRVLDDGTEEHEVIPIRYQVEVFAIGADAVFTVTTYGSWLVEGNFLIVFDQEGLRTGYRLDSTMQTITTKEYVGKKVEEVDLPE
jgi:hypothetical protein